MFQKAKGNLKAFCPNEMKRKPQDGARRKPQLKQITIIIIIIIIKRKQKSQKSGKY